MRDKDIVVSDKHVTIRIIAFALAVILAVTAFAVGINKIGGKEPGFQHVSTEADEEAPLYASGIEFRHYFEGGSNEIKQALKVLSEEYSVVLKRGYKLLDGKNEYAAYQNIATLNKNPGAEINVNAELYAVLQDAYAKTMEREGFNMFAGALYNEWNSILMLDEPQEFDPLNNENERERIEKICDEVNNYDNFALEFVDDEKFTVKFTVSDEYLDFAREMELESNIIDLNTLRDAYLCDIVTAVLEEKGYTQGFIITDSGISLSLSDHAQGKCLVYDVSDGAVVQCGSAEVMAGTVCSTMKAQAFEEDELGYYVIEDYYRNPNFSVKTGGFCDIISASYVISKNSAADTVYMNMKMQSCATEGEIVEVTDTGAYSAAYILRGETTVFVNPAAYQIFALEEDCGYKKEVK